MRAATLKKIVSMLPRNPYSKSILVSGDGGHTTLTGTDCDVDARFRLPHEGDPFGAVQVDPVMFGKQLHAIRPGKDDRAALSVVGDRLFVTVADKKVHFPVIPGRDFPDPFPKDGVDGEAEPVDAAFWDALRWLRPACSADETRFNMSGVWFDPKGGKLAATDTHRLHVVPRATKLSGTLRAGALDVAFKARALSAEGWTLAFATDRRPTFRHPCAEVSARCVEDRFPPVDAVIPKRFATTARIEAATLGEASMLAAAHAVKDKGFSWKQIHLDLREDERVRVSVPGDFNGKQESDRFSQDIACLTYSGPAVEASYNAVYLLDALAGAEGHVELKANKSSDPMVVSRAGGSFALIMPMGK